MNNEQTKCIGSDVDAYPSSAPIAWWVKKEIEVKLCRTRIAVLRYWNRALGIKYVMISLGNHVYS